MGDEQVTFIEMKETYEAAIDEAKKIIKGKLRAEEGRVPQRERALQLAARMKGLHDQIREILNFVKEKLERVEVT